MTRWWTAALLLLVPVVPGRAALQIVTDTLPAASGGVFYNQAIAISGGTCGVNKPGTASSTIDSGALPPGLSVTSPPGVESWTIQGTPTTGGTFQFALHIYWTHQGVSPFDPNCTEDAVKTLSLTVGAPQVPLVVNPSQVSVTYHIAQFPPAPVTVQVTSGGSVAAAFTATANASTGGTWLSVSPTSATTPAQLSLNFSISGLQAGIYTGSVTLNAGAAAPVTIAVTLTVVADANVVLQANPQSLGFSYVNGGPNPAAQPVAITVSGQSVIFQADINAVPPGTWLNVTPTGAATPAQLIVSVNPKGLAPGTYTGTITLHLTGLTAIAATISVSFSVQPPPALPTITTNGVVNAANLTSAIAPGTWVSIFGGNLSATTRGWQNADFAGGKLPTVLDNVSVTIDGKAAPVAYVSPSQLNVLAPDSTNTGLLSVQVKAPAGTSASVLGLQQTAAPAFFQFRAAAAAYVAGTHADNSYLAGPALIQQGIVGTPAKPGETIVLYGTGFGATQPSISATAPVPSALPLANPADLRIRIAGVDSQIAFAGLISPGLYQFNVVVPQVPDGDQTVVAELRGLLTKLDLMLTVQH